MISRNEIDYDLLNKFSLVISKKDRDLLTNLMESVELSNLVMTITHLDPDDLVMLFYLLPTDTGSLLLDELPIGFIRMLNKKLKETSSKNDFNVHLKVKNLLLGKLIENPNAKDLKEQISRLENENKTLKNEQAIIQQKELSNKIDENLSTYVSDAIDSLKLSREIFDDKSVKWEQYGFLSFVCAIIISLASVSFAVYYLLYAGVKLDWMVYTFLSLKMLIIILLVCAFSNYAYSISKAYVHESLIRVDREHAIRFGEMFLKIYGDRLEQAEVKSVFENWNFSSNSAFNISESKKESLTDLNKSVDLISKMMEIIKINK